MKTFRSSNKLGLVMDVMKIFQRSHKDLVKHLRTISRQPHLHLQKTRRFYRDLCKV